jgi:hypothetical protein
MKKCNKCGAENADDSVFCAGCGASLDQPVVEQAAAPASFDAPAYTAPVAAASVEKNTATLWLILNIVATVLCCPGWLFTGLGIVFAAIGSGSYKKGDYVDMKKKVKLSLIFFIIGVVLGLIGWILCFTLPALLTAIPFMSNFSSYN